MLLIISRRRSLSSCAKPAPGSSILISFGRPTVARAIWTVRRSKALRSRPRALALAIEGDGLGLAAVALDPAGGARTGPLAEVADVGLKVDKRLTLENFFTEYISVLVSLTRGRALAVT